MSPIQWRLKENGKVVFSLQVYPFPYNCSQKYFISTSFLKLMYSQSFIDLVPFTYFSSNMNCKLITLNWDYSKNGQSLISGFQLHTRVLFKMNRITLTLEMTCQMCTVELRKYISPVRKVTVYAGKNKSVTFVVPALSMEDNS